MDNQSFLDYLRSMVNPDPADVKKQQLELEAKKKAEDEAKRKALQQMQQNVNLDPDKAKAFVQGFKGVK